MTDGHVLPRARARTKRKRPRGPMEEMWFKVLCWEMGLWLLQILVWVWMPPGGGGLDLSWRIFCLCCLTYWVHEAYTHWRHHRNNGT